MNKIRLAALAAAVVSLLASGCVTHTLFVDLSPDGGIRYVDEGDSLDIYDGRIRLPEWAPWTLVDRSSGLNADSSLSIQLDYRAPLQDSVQHPLAPFEDPGVIEIQRSSNLLVHTVRLKITFPAWRATELYGDPDAFVPDEVKQLEEIGADTLVSPDKRDHLKRLRAIGMQKAAAQRYLKQEQALLESWFRAQGDTLVDSVMSDGMERFSAILQAWLFTLHGKDPLDVSLDWYQDLRGAMATAASEATGGDLAWFEAASDSIEHRYKTWIDLQDDAVQVRVILPAWRVIADPDTTMGDTLAWDVEVEALADSTVVITAAGITPVTATWVIALLLVLIGGGGLLIRALRKRSLSNTTT